MDRTQRRSIWDSEPSRSPIDVAASPRRHDSQGALLWFRGMYSIFEPHTDLIKRGKERTPIEFGHKVFLAESGHGLIPQYRVLTGNAADSDQVAPSLESHVDIFGHAPDLCSGAITHRGVCAWRRIVDQTRI